MRNINELLDKARAHYERMTPEERDAMHKVQRESWVRGMAPCEHGVRDWETCEKCREQRP